MHTHDSAQDVFLAQQIRQTYQDELKQLETLIDNCDKTASQIDTALKGLVSLQTRDSMIEHYADISGLNAHMERKAWLVRKLHGGL